MSLLSMLTYSKLFSLKSIYPQGIRSLQSGKTLFVQDITHLLKQPQ